jgi:hypothetical protein
MAQSIVALGEIANDFTHLVVPILFKSRKRNSALKPVIQAGITEIQAIRMFFDDEAIR